MKKWNALFLSLLFATGTANCSDCFDSAGRDYHIDADLLRAIAWQESAGKQYIIGKNPGSGYGAGVMQIDSQNFPSLASMGIPEQRLLNDACMNIYTGAYYLAKAFKKFGYSWPAVGAYNAGFRQSEKQARRRYHYATLIFMKYRAIKLSRLHQNIPMAQKKGQTKTGAYVNYRAAIMLPANNRTR